MQLKLIRLLIWPTEYQQLESEITRIVDQTKWNEMTLLDGSAGSASNGTFKIQLGADNGQFMALTIGKFKNNCSWIRLFDFKVSMLVLDCPSLYEILIEL